MTYPQTVPLVRIYAGDTYFQSYTFKDSEGAVIDLLDAGWRDWRAQYRPSRLSNEYVEFTVVDNDSPDGVIKVSMTAATTLTLHHNGIWDLEATNENDGTVRTFITSGVDVLHEVTRA